MPTAPTSVPPRSEKTAQGSLRWPGQALLTDPTLAQVLFSVWSGDPCVIVPSPPGSGKTRLVSLLAAALADKAGLRVAIAAQTRAQAAELAARTARATDRCALIGKKNVPFPGAGTCPVVTGTGARWRRRSGGEVLIATTARWLHVNAGQLGADVLLVDEAYQCTYADVGALGALATQLVCVGDPGQIAPVVTGDVTRWATSPTGPHQPAPCALLAAHGDAMSVRKLRHSWRLGPASCELVSGLFYPDLPFTSMRPDEAIEIDGQALAEIGHRYVTANEGPTDPDMLAEVAAHARELMTGTYHGPFGTRAMSAADVAIVVPHVAQAATLRALLADEPDVLVDTANALQGIERPAVVSVHPLVGYRTLSPFAADRGRLCVALSRHRAHMSVFIDSESLRVAGNSPADKTVLEEVAATPAL